MSLGTYGDHPYSKKEYAQVVFVDPSTNKTRTVYIEVSSKTINKTSGWVVNKDGSRKEKETKDAVQVELLILHHIDMVEYRPMRLNLHYCELEASGT